MSEDRMAVAKRIEAHLVGCREVDRAENGSRVLLGLSSAECETLLAALRDTGTGRGDEAEDDRFSRELHAAYDRCDADGYARILSGRLRQMDKRARAANIRADGLEATLRLVRVRAAAAEAELAAGRSVLADPSPGGKKP